MLNCACSRARASSQGSTTSIWLGARPWRISPPMMALAMLPPPMKAMALLSVFMLFPGIRRPRTV
jgi:hypothetical protein